MRFAAAAFVCAALLAGSFAIASADGGTPFESAGFHLMLPGGWTEKPNLEQLAVKGFQKADPGDPVQAFAWANPQSTEFLLVQALSSSAQIPAGEFRSNLEALNKAIPAGMGASTVTPAITDDGLVMTSTFESVGKNVDTLAQSEGLVDNTRHLRAYSVMCMMVTPVTDSARADCRALLASFAITLDRATFLPLEPK